MPLVKASRESVTAGSRGIASQSIVMEKVEIHRAVLTKT